MCQRNQVERQETLVGHILSASLVLVSILAAVIAVLASEYRQVESDTRIAEPIFNMVIGTTFTAVLAGLIAILALMFLFGWQWPYRVILGAALALVVAVTVGIPLVVYHWI